MVVWFAYVEFYTQFIGFIVLICILAEVERVPSDLQKLRQN